MYLMQNMLTFAVRVLEIWLICHKLSGMKKTREIQIQENNNKSHKINEKSWKLDHKNNWITQSHKINLWIQWPWKKYSGFITVKKPNLLYVPALQSNILEIFYINSLINQDAFIMLSNWVRFYIYYNFFRTPWMH